jgi:hypothetical protein
MPNVGVGHMLLVVRCADVYAARFTSPVGIFHCAGARTTEGNDVLNPRIRAETGRKCGACDVTIIPGVATAGCMRAASAYLDSPSKTEISSRPANNSWHDAELLWRFMGSAPQARRCRLLLCRGAATRGVVWAGRR